MGFLKTMFDWIDNSQEQIDYLEQKLKEEVQKKEDLLNQKIHLRLADFIGEISSLSGINILDMKINITTNIWVDAQRTGFDMEYAKSRQESHNLEIQLSADRAEKNINATPFKFYLYFPLDFEQKQADGKTLLDHCSARLGKTTSYSLPAKEIVVDKNIADIVCEFSVGQLKDTILSSQKEMLITAISNCVECGKIIKVEKEESKNKHEEKTL